MRASLDFDILPQPTSPAMLQIISYGFFLKEIEPETLIFVASADAEESSEDTIFRTPVFCSFFSTFRRSNRHACEGRLAVMSTQSAKGILYE